MVKSTNSTAEQVKSSCGMRGSLSCADDVAEDDFTMVGSILTCLSEAGVNVGCFSSGAFSKGVISFGDTSASLTGVSVLSSANRPFVGSSMG